MAVSACGRGLVPGQAAAVLLDHRRFLFDYRLAPPVLPAALAPRSARHTRAHLRSRTAPLGQANGFRRGIRAALRRAVLAASASGANRRTAVFLDHALALRLVSI